MSLHTHTHTYTQQRKYVQKSGRRGIKTRERERRKITEPCKFSLPEVKGDSLEVAGRVGRIGALRSGSP